MALILERMSSKFDVSWYSVVPAEGVDCVVGFAQLMTSSSFVDMVEDVMEFGAVEGDWPTGYFNSQSPLRCLKARKNPLLCFMLKNKPEKYPS